MKEMIDLLEAQVEELNGQKENKEFEVRVAKM